MELVRDLLKYPLLFGSSTASAVLPDFYEEENLYVFVPKNYYNLPSELCLVYPWEEDLEIEFSSEEMNDIFKFQIIQSFASKLLKNTKDINPEFAKIASEYFWDLV